jgi:hypothetical protein
MPDWLNYFFNDVVTGNGAILLVAGAASGFLVTSFTNRLSVPLPTG